MQNALPYKGYETNLAALNGANGRTFKGDNAYDMLTYMDVASMSSGEFTETVIILQAFNNRTFNGTIYGISLSQPYLESLPLSQQANFTIPFYFSAHPSAQKAGYLGSFIQSDILHLIVQDYSSTNGTIHNFALDASANNFAGYIPLSKSVDSLSGQLDDYLTGRMIQIGGQSALAVQASADAADRSTCVVKGPWPNCSFTLISRFGENLTLVDASMLPDGSPTLTLGLLKNGKEAACLIKDANTLIGNVTSDACTLLVSQTQNLHWISKRFPEDQPMAIGYMTNWIGFGKDEIAYFLPLDDRLNQMPSEIVIGTSDAFTISHGLGDIVDITEFRGFSLIQLLDDNHTSHFFTPTELESPTQWIIESFRFTNMSALYGQLFDLNDRTGFLLALPNQVCLFENLHCLDGDVALERSTRCFEGHFAKGRTGFPIIAEHASQGIVISAPDFSMGNLEDAGVVHILFFNQSSYDTDIGVSGADWA